MKIIFRDNVTDLDLAVRAYKFAAKQGLINPRGDSTLVSIGPENKPESCTYFAVWKNKKSITVHQC